MNRYKAILALTVTAAFALSAAGCASAKDNDNDDQYVDLDAISAAEITQPEEEIINYHWSLQPSVAAENIIVFDGSQIDTDNQQSDMYERYAVIVSNGLYGLINYQGEVIIKPEYNYYYVCPCGQIVLYNITDPENDVREYRTLNSDGKVVDYLDLHESPNIEYYYDSEDKKVYYAREAEDWTVHEYTGQKTVVAMLADVDDSYGSYEMVEPDEAPKYGIIKEGKAVGEFEYDDYYAPPYIGTGVTAIALEKNGKWGYVDSNGEKLIEFNCDEVFSSYNGELSDSPDSGHPYLFSEELLPVSVNYSFGYYSLDGKLVVKTNEFSQARPVHHGRAWVCVDDMWGVIYFGDEEEEEELPPATTTTTTTTATTTYSWTTTTSQSTTTAPPATTTEASSSDISTDDTLTDPAYTDPIASDTEPELPTETQIPDQPDIPATPQPEPEVPADTGV